MEQDQSGAAASSVAGFDSAVADPSNAYTGSVVQADGAPVTGESAVAADGGAQGADATMYSAEHASLNGTAAQTQTANYQFAGEATENGTAATNEMGEPVPEPSTYAEGKVVLAHSRDFVSLYSLLFSF
jgi:pre-mRNA-processing factor 39